MNEIHPPFLEELGTAPVGVCSRWMDAAPCGAAGTHHVIWDLQMTNGCVCAAHTAEARERWVYIGLHPYTADCAAAARGEGKWRPGEDRCVRDELPAGAEAMTIERHDHHPPGTVCRPAGNGLCEPLGPPQVPEAEQPLCANCGNPIRRAPASPTGWTHGRNRLAREWQGMRCPGAITGATPGAPIPSKVPDLRGVPLGVLPALGGDEGPAFGSSI